MQGEHTQDAMAIDPPPNAAADPRDGRARIPWAPFLVALALLLVAFYPAIVRTVVRWWDDPEYSHGFLMPVVAAWLLWDRRERLRVLEGGTSLWAIPLLLLSLPAVYVLQLDFLSFPGPYGFVLGIGAVILAFLGWPGLRMALPSMVALWLACPLPWTFEQRITVPLKETSAQLAVGMLDVSGITTFLDGNMIHLEGADSLWVADACSGIRSLISLLSIAVVACLVWKRHWAIKALVIAAAVPIAVLVNGFRIWLTGFLTVHVSPESAQGVFHFFEGFALFALAGLLLLGFAALLGVIFPRRTA